MTWLKVLQYIIQHAYDDLLHYFPSRLLHQSPLQEYTKFLPQVILECLPISLDKRFQFGEELLKWIQIWGVRWQVHQLDSCVEAHLYNAIRMMERGIIHDNDGFRFWPSVTVGEKLLDKVLEDCTINRSLKYPS